MLDLNRIVVVAILRQRRSVPSTILASLPPNQGLRLRGAARIECREKRHGDNIPRQLEALRREPG